MKKTLQILLFLNIAFIGSASAQSDIKEVDFNNFTYQPYCGNAEPQTMTVTKGLFFEEKDVTPAATPETPAKNAKPTPTPQTPIRVIERRYFKPYTTIYGDLNGDAINEAIVLTTCSRGGVESYTEGFIYGIKDGSAGLLARIEGGDRALGGLRSVKIENGSIVVERSRPDFTNDACCAEFAETTGYRLADGSLIAIGEKTSVELYPPTRLQFPEGSDQLSFNVKINRNDKIKRFIINGRKGRTLTVTTKTETGNLTDSTVRIYKGVVTMLNPKPVRNGPENPATNTLSAKLKENGDYVFEVSNLSKEELDITVTVDIK